MRKIPSVVIWCEQFGVLISPADLAFNRNRFYVGAVIAAFADISIWQLLLVAGVAMIGSLVGGVTGYGTGALMPLVLVPIIGPEPVVPIIAISGLLTNSGRVFRIPALHRLVALLARAVRRDRAGDDHRLRLHVAHRPRSAILIGVMLILTVPLRYAMRRRATALGDGGLLFSSMGYGAVMGGTVGAGVILLSILLSAGLQGAAVIATDAMISIVVALCGCGCSATPEWCAQVIAFGLLMAS